MTTDKQEKPYPDVNPQPSFPEIEKQILKFWKEEKIFEKSVEMRPAGERGENEYVFYDGPPFANGLPHYGHLLTGYVKDIIPRYYTMRGRRVERRFGWDCHGLPAEMEAEKELGISGRKAIEEFGIDKFNEHCRKSVLKYTKEWESYVTRQARWVDFKNDYKTMDLTYMESVLWAFKELWKKGLIYEGYRVMPYSWACQTPLSNFETRLDNATRPRQDPAVTVLFTLDPRPGDPGPIKMMIWTTTPWTLPLNVAIAVGEEIDYALMEEDGVYYLIAEAVIPKYKKQLEKAVKKGVIKGKELLERTYQPIFDYLKDTPNAFRVLPADWVNTEEGTGIVHMSTGTGDVDQEVGNKFGVPTVCPVDHAGKYTEEIRDYAGRMVLDCNKDIIQDLKKRGVLVKHETYEHNYPHCWRTDTPLIFRAISSWYVSVTKIRDRLVELNQQINWIPEHIRDGQFGKWLAGARDWSISRNRFWGAPIPVWKSDNPDFPRIDVYGSLDELERDFGVRPDDLHRPYIDQLTRPNPDDPSGKSTMRRVEEVLDCWFESGSMPYAQVHYPFENKAWFENHFPADFIVEYVAQTRGWFYNLVVLAGALFDKPPFKNCMCHGVVLDVEGRKLSKRLRNYPDPVELFETIGSDALRWFLVSSSILRGGDLQIDKEGKLIAEVVRTVINPIWNAYYFFTLYANADGIKADFDTSSKQLLDRYILAKLHEFVKDTEQSLDAYDVAGACQHTLSFIDALNNWYIRRSRDRFWKAEKDQDKIDAYNTLFVVLCTFTKTVAPLLPLISEEIYRGLTGELSVHLTDWPEAEKIPADRELVAAMDRVRDVCSVGLSMREANRLRTRLPLASVTIAGKNTSQLADYSALIKDELNVKEVFISEDIEKFASFNLKVNARKAGPRLGAKVKEVIKESKSGNWKRLDDGRVEVAGEVLEEDEFELALTPKEGLVAQPLSSYDAVVVLDTELTPELIDEGKARDLVRLIQQARKKAGFHIADHIELALGLPPELEEVIKKHQQYLAGETLADSVTYGPLEGCDYSEKAKLDESEIVLSLKRI
ncbi:MAG: isoleucine--tRNA ligase [Candidatus Dadabacteria bacterium]|nr:MAG: isoleucine--tRNA ligase [Candidatus Dadabacteria bacterium]